MEVEHLHQHMLLLYSHLNHKYLLLVILPSLSLLFQPFQAANDNCCIIITIVVAPVHMTMTPSMQLPHEYAHAHLHIHELLLLNYHSQFHLLVI
jgi:hypothetical protein